MNRKPHLARQKSRRRLIALTVTALALPSALWFPAALAQGVGDAAALFRKLDITHDGWLSGTELENGRWLKFDADGNREVTRAEFLAGSAREKSGSAPRKPAKAPVPSAGSAGSAGSAASPGRTDAGGLALYRAGDSVEVSYAGQWNRGTVKKVEGSGASVRVTVAYSFSGSRNEGTFSYNAVRFASGTGSAAAPPAAPAAPTTGGPLALGDYVCTEGLYATGLTPRGYFTLKANGTYTYPARNSSGRYRYDAKTGRITWLSGYFATAGATTTVFTPGKRVSQIDITFRTTSGPLYWSCGHNN